MTQHLLRSYPNPNSKPYPTPNPKDDEEDMTPLVDLVRKEASSPGELFPIAFFFQIFSPTHLTNSHQFFFVSHEGSRPPKKNARVGSTSLQLRLNPRIGIRWVWPLPLLLYKQQVCLALPCIAMRLVWSHHIRQCVGTTVCAHRQGSYPVCAHRR